MPLVPVLELPGQELRRVRSVPLELRALLVRSELQGEALRVWAPLPRAGWLAQEPWLATRRCSGVSMAIAEAAVSMTRAHKRHRHQTIPMLLADLGKTNLAMMFGAKIRILGVAAAVRRLVERVKAVVEVEREAVEGVCLMR